MRIDSFLFESGLAESRTEAKSLIKEGAVSYLGRVISKPSFDYNDTADKLTVNRSAHRYVSRGGLKLEYALDYFKLDVTARRAIDVGASSGGFTDCLLQRGVLSVIAVDSGTDQLSPKIRQDSRVTSIENYNARYMKREDFPYIPDIAVMDVSFISATLIIPAVYSVLDGEADFICLIKPQFEVGRSNIGKGGIVKDEKARDGAVSKVVDFASGVGFQLVGVTRSAIEGGDGNIEFVAHFKKNRK